MVNQIKKIDAQLKEMSFSQSISLKREKQRRPQQGREAEASYYPQLAEKLRDHPTFKDCNDQQVAELVNRITKPEELISYFDLTQDRESDSAAALLDGEVEALEVQLVLKHLSCKAEKRDDIESMLLQEYGPLQAYLVIGEMVLEWDWKSLVIPHGKPLRDSARSSIVRADVRADVREAELPSVRVDLLKTKVLDLVARYNRMYYYHAIRRNAHDFVCSVLETMNYSPLPPQMQSNLKDYLNALENNISTSIATQFDTHKVLDQYVERQERRLNDLDIEYLIVHYFMLHVVERMKHDDPWKWECTEPNCKMKILEALINHKKILLNKFITVKYNFYDAQFSDTKFVQSTHQQSS